MPLRPGHGVLSAAGPCRCTEVVTELIHAVRGRGSGFARHNPVASGVEFAIRLVTLRGGYAGTPWATGCAHGRRRQPAHAGAGISFVPPACGGLGMSAAIRCHQGSDLRTPWSRYSCISRLSCPRGPGVVGIRAARVLRVQPRFACAWVWPRVRAAPGMRVALASGGRSTRWGSV